MTDEPSERWTPADDAMLSFELLPAAHPTRFAHAFRLRLQAEETATRLPSPIAYVTPESVPQWGDFAAAKQWAHGPEKLSTRAWWGREAADVAFVPVVATSEWNTPTADEESYVAFVTLIWRPELETPGGSAWRVHAIGDMLPPSALPRTARHRPA